MRRGAGGKEDMPPGAPTNEGNGAIATALIEASTSKPGIHHSFGHARLAEPNRERT